MERREGKPPPPNPALPYREDCWSEGETSALIEAWGDRYVELSRGNLRQQHWQEVADAVNARRRSSGSASRRPPRTDVQCKNRIDTLKKKYKVERTRILESGGAAESQWTFFSRLDSLIGSSVNPASAAAKKPPPSPPLAQPLPYRRKASPLPAAAAVDSKRPKMALPVNDSIYRRAAAAAAAAAEEEENSDSASSSRSSVGERSRKGSRDGDREGIRELARAIERLGEIYERVEGAKQQQMMELEKQRMEFAKALEFERMQIFMDTQIQLAKIKRSKRADAGEQGYSTALPLLFEAFQTNM